jgi:hypothetical protein
MAEYYFSAQVDDETTLCIAPLTERRVELSGQEIEDRSGYFLYLSRGGAEPNDVEILARLSSEEAVLRLRKMLSLS